MSLLLSFIEPIGLFLELVGVFIIVAGAAYATWRCVRTRHEPHAFGRYRLDLGRALLLGLEFLVAGDIIRTVIIDPTLESVLILAIIVLVRTVLGVALAFELTGRGPWRPNDSNAALAPPPEASRPRDLSSP